MRLNLPTEIAYKISLRKIDHNGGAQLTLIQLTLGRSSIKIT